MSYHSKPLHSKLAILHRPPGSVRSGSFPHRTKTDAVKRSETCRRFFKKCLQHVPTDPANILRTEPSDGVNLPMKSTKPATQLRKWRISNTQQLLWMLFCWESAKNQQIKLLIMLFAKPNIIENFPRNLARLHGWLRRFSPGSLESEGNGTPLAKRGHLDSVDASEETLDPDPISICVPNGIFKLRSWCLILPTFADYLS